jgi:FkbM family methyltransferase
MIYLKNRALLFLIRIANKYGRGYDLRKKTFSSQRILENNFPKTREFNFIQVGANDGISFDFLYDFIINRDSSGIVIEPVHDYFKELEFNYERFSKIIKINKAVHPYKKEVVMYKIAPHAVKKYPDWVKGIASLDSEHHKKTKIDSNDILEEIIEAETLMSIVGANLDSLKLDYFQVDTEGFDFEVVKMIDFNLIIPDIIKYESVNLNDEDRNKLILLLKNQGYFLFDEFGDTVGINLKKIKL